jgi:hypothetical protein
MNRRCFPGLLIVAALVTNAFQSTVGGQTNPDESGTTSDQAKESSPLREAWLRFHEAQLCQGVDAVFQFHQKGMEVWCRVEDDKTYQKFLELVEPLRASYEIDLYTTRPLAEKKTNEDNDPPPSIWNNAEIRGYLQDPFGKNPTGGGISIRPASGGERDADYFLKQRMLMFAHQTLEWNEKMKRYALDLPDLVHAAFGAGAVPGLRARAIAASRAHAEGVDRYAERLTENLSHALPKATRRFRPAEKEKLPAATASPDTSAEQVSNAGQSIARRIHRFIHPQHHTVGLVDLREPSLLESLKTLRNMVDGFQRSAH